MSATSLNRLSLILLPGLNGDARVLAPQCEAFPQLFVPAWQSPRQGESLAEYAKRFAQSLDPGCPCLLGGVSFGGIVALEIVRHLPAKACVLIACCRSTAGLPRALRLLRPVGAMVPQQVLAELARWGEQTAGTRQPFAKLKPEDRAFRRWALQALLTWQTPTITSPLFQIHGAQDATFPVALSGAETVVADAGHLLTLTHAAAVNEFLRSVIGACEIEAA